MGIDFKPYLRLLRINDWRGYFLMAIFGFIVSKGFLASFEKIIIFFVMVFLFLGFGFSLNDCFGTKEDRLNKYKKNVIVLRAISLRKGLVFSISLGVLGLALSILFGLKVFLVCLGTTLLGFFYHTTPLKLKSQPFLDLISHGIFAGSLIFLIPILIFSKDLLLSHYLIAFSIFYFSVILELRNHVEDYRIDKKAGLKTTACFLGMKNSKKLLNYLVIFYPFILFPVFFLVLSQFIWIFLIFTLIFLFFFLFKRNYKIVKNYKINDLYTIFSFALLAGVMVL